MRDESAEVSSTTSGSRKARWINAAALAVLVFVVAAVVLWQRPWSQSSSPAGPAAYPSDAQAQLTEIASNLSAGGGVPRDDQALGPDRRASAWARQIRAAMDSLNVGTVQWQYISGGDRPLRDDGSSQAQFVVEAATGATAEFTARVRPSGGESVSLTGIDAADDPLPLWLAGDLQISRSGATTVVEVRGPGADPSSELIASLDLQRAVDTAHARVSSVVADADDRLTVIAASSEAIAARVLGRDLASVRQIAGVATRRDGSDGDLSRDVIVLNPQQFKSMDSRAAQVVMTHEAAHVMTGAVDSSAEPWVVEGFADFVALQRDTAPLSVSAGQILARVAASSAPRQLPDRSQFASDAKDLATNYESAWMAMRAVGRRHSKDDVVAFYRRVLGGETVARAAKEVLNESVESITAAWREDLEREARRLSR